MNVKLGRLAGKGFCNTTKVRDITVDKAGYVLGGETSVKDTLYDMTRGHIDYISSAAVLATVHTSSSAVVISQVKESYDLH